MKKIDDSAARHLAVGALEVDDIAVGFHDLARLQLTLTFPDHAAVERDGGPQGDGMVPGSFPKTVTLSAALLFIERCGLKGPAGLSLWCQCIAASAGEKAEKLMPAEATEALKLSQAAAEPPKRKTSAKRIGVNAAEIEIKRLTVQEFKSRS